MDPTENTPLLVVPNEIHWTLIPNGVKLIFIAVHSKKPITFQRTVIFAFEKKRDHLLHLRNKSRSDGRATYAYFLGTVRGYVR
jgi:hypothetical protein